MALGKAIVATDLPGIRRIIQNGRNGLLVKSENSKVMAEAILELYYNKNTLQDIGKNNLKDINKYDWQHINKHIHNKLINL
jgi:glycosyltransferase involved in cell wall biosynthesis